MTSGLGTNSETTNNPKADSVVLPLDVLSFMLKEEHTGIKVDACIKLPQKEHDSVTWICILTKIPPCVLVLVSFLVGILFPLWLSTLFDRISTMRFLVWWTSSIGIITLLFWVSCWYRIRMASLIATERKLGYVVLKELAGKFPEMHGVYAAINHALAQLQERTVSIGQSN